MKPVTLKLRGKSGNLYIITLNEYPKKRNSYHLDLCLHDEIVQKDIGDYSTIQDAKNKAEQIEREGS